MLDRDLAQMYGTQTKVLNQSVKRNLERFPLDFMFQLTDEEWTVLKSQIVTSSWGGARRPPYAFTELGVAMLSSTLNSKVAIQINMGIMRTFVAIRHTLPTVPVDNIAEFQSEIKELKAYVEEVFTDYNDINEDTRMQLELINETLAELQATKKALGESRRPIGY